MDPGTTPAIDRRTAPAPQVMLLSVWRAVDGAWHARIVLPDAQRHEFTSPFDLAQFLGQWPRALQWPVAGTGLR